MAANAADLTTLAAAKAHLGIVTTNEEPEIERIITAASKLLVGVLSRPIKAADYTLDCNGRGGSRLYIPHFPVVSFAAVTIDGKPVDPTTVGSTGTGYLYDPATYSLVLRGLTFSRGVMNVHVAYRAGYETVPEDAANATLELVAAMMRKRDRKDHGLASRSIGVESMAFTNDDIPPSVKLYVEQNKRVTV